MVRKLSRQAPRRGNDSLVFPEGYADGKSFKTKSCVAQTVRQDKRKVRLPLAQTRKPRSAAYLEKFAQRSEEHTSELQSLMRISYAVFCLKKKKHQESKP